MPAVPSSGEKFNQQYELLEVLGSGGVSTVFKAKKLDDGQIVALKVLHTVEKDNDKFKQRFLDSVKAVSESNVAGIAKVIQFGDSDNGFAFAVTEYSDGISLRSALKNPGRVPALMAVKVAARLANLMEGVHSAGLLHRDLKTDNILFEQPKEINAENIRLVDFAFAYLDESDSFAPAGTLIGSPRYMSPEQGGGKPTDARSDIYSLTVCFYEMITGEKPYAANTSALILYKHLNDPIPQIQQDQIERFVPAVNSVIGKGMAKLPEDRYQSMKEFADALNSLYAELEKVKPIVVVKKDGAAQPAESKGSPVVMITIGVLVLVLGAVFALKPQGGKKTEAEFDQYQNERKKKTVAFLEADVKRLERRHAHDPDHLRNLAGRLRALAAAQRDAGDLAGAQKSVEEAVALFNTNGGAADPDMLTKLRGELALIKIQAQDYKGAGQILVDSHEQLSRLFPQPELLVKHEASLIPARLLLNIHLHKFENAGKDLVSVFDLSHSIDKDTDAPPAVATAKSAWEAFSNEALEGPQDKMTGLAFVDLLMEKFLETDKDLCKAPADKARALIAEIPQDTPGLQPVADRTKTLLAKCDSAGSHKTAESK